MAQDVGGVVSPGLFGGGQNCARVITTDRADDMEPVGIEAGNLTTLGDLTGATLTSGLALSLLGGCPWIMQRRRDCFCW